MNRSGLLLAKANVFVLKVKLVWLPPAIAIAELLEAAPINRLENAMELGVVSNVLIVSSLKIVIDRDLPPEMQRALLG